MWFVSVYEAGDNIYLFCCDSKEIANKYMKDTLHYWQGTDYISESIASYDISYNKDYGSRLTILSKNSDVTDINVFENDEFLCGDKVVIYHRSYGAPVLANPDNTSVLHDLIMQHGELPTEGEYIDLIDEEFGEKYAYVKWDNGDCIEANDLIIKPLKLNSFYDGLGGESE